MESSSPVFRFGRYELRPHVRELYKNGIKLKIRPQPLQVLHRLVSHPGDVVTRDQLRQQLWSADTFVDFEHSLNTAMKELRRVLGDAVAEPRYIETLPRLGYRFIASVDAAQIPPAAVGVTHIPPAQAEPAQPLPLQPAARGGVLDAVVKQRMSRRRRLAVGAGVAALIGFAVWLARPGARLTSAAHPLNSLAVLPLENLSGDPSEEFFADGMTDQLITDLAKVGSLRVVSRTSVTRYKGTKKAMPEIARELDVDAIVEGSVVRSGNRVRVTAQLIEASTDRHLWAETYDGDIGDVLKLQGKVTEAIAQEVRAQLTPQQQTQLRRADVVNPEAYDDYLKGRLYLTAEFYKPESLRKAQHLFEEAVHKDPNFALAYAGLADTYVYLAFSGAVQKESAYSSAKQALGKAVELDESIGEAHDTLGLLSADFDWDWDTADREFKRAIALAPSYSCAHEDRANFLASLGRRAETLEEIAKIQQLDYAPAATWTVSNAYNQLRDYPALIEASKRALLLDPKDSGQHYFLGVGYERTGKLQEAISEYEKAVQLSNGAPDPAVALAHAYSGAGKKAEAKKMLRDLERKSRESPVSPYTMATIYAGLDENDKAFELLEKAYTEKSLGFPFHLQSDLVLDSLRPDPRFQSLLHGIGLNAEIMPSVGQ